MILKDECYFNNNLRLGQDIVVQIMKEQVGKKGPTVTRNIILDYENVKIYPYNRDHVVFEKTFKELQFFKGKPLTFITWVCPLLKPLIKYKE